MQIEGIAKTQNNKLNSILTFQQKNAYQKDGFLVIKNFIASDICELLIERANLLINNFDPGIAKTIFSANDQRHARNQYFLDSGDKIHFFFEEAAFDDHGNLKYEKSKCINKFGHALHDLDPVFNCFSHMNKIAVLLHDLNMQNPLIMQSMYICKQPHIGGEVTCHQDATYLHAANHNIVGLWFALEDATLENGCLWAIPGGQHTNLKSKFIRENNTTKLEKYDETPWELDKMIPLEVPRGSLIVLHSLLPHMSKENVSSHSRHAYTLHVMENGIDYPSTNWLQRAPNMPFLGFLD